MKSGRSPWKYARLNENIWWREEKKISFIFVMLHFWLHNNLANLLALDHD